VLLREAAVKRWHCCACIGLHGVALRGRRQVLPYPLIAALLQLMRMCVCGRVCVVVCLHFDLSVMALIKWLLAGVRGPQCTHTMS